MAFVRVKVNEEKRAHYRNLLELKRKEVDNKEKLEAEKEERYKHTLKLAIEISYGVAEQLAKIGKLKNFIIEDNYFVIELK
jgi:hypothetical protein